MFLDTRIANVYLIPLQIRIQFINLLEMNTYGKLKFSKVRYSWQTYPSKPGNSQVVQQSGLCLLTTEGASPITGQENKIPEAAGYSQKM